MASIQEPRLMARVRYLNFIYILPFTFQILTQAKISRSWSGFPFNFNNLKTAPLQTRIVNWSSSVFAFAISIYKYTTVSEQTFLIPAFAFTFYNSQYWTALQKQELSINHRIHLHWQFQLTNRPFVKYFFSLNKLRVFSICIYIL